MHILASYCSYDDDPCETLDERGMKKTLKRSEQRNRRDPEVNRVKKRARYRPLSSYFNLYLQTSSDDDPCETLDGRGTKKTLRRSEQEKTTQTLDRSEMQKEHGGTKKALDRSGLVSTNAILIMLKQEEQLKVWV